LPRKERNVSLSLPIEALAASDAFCHLSQIAGIQVDLRYASDNNFVGRDLYSPYDCAWLHVEAAQGLEKAVHWLAQHAPGYTALVLDALRPQRVQQQLWDALAGTNLQSYLAAPERGSIHSFGMALDITLIGPNGKEIDMGTGFDEMSEASHPSKEASMLASGRLTAEHLENRRRLRGAMAAGGFTGISSEWWHYDCGNRDVVRASFLRVL
jgi:D-alanyl-D-alanine dipeptidase